jgi:hypothetical protein
VIGKRAVGKTCLVIYEIYRQLQHKIDQLYVFGPGEYIASEYAGIVDKIFSPFDIPRIISQIKANRDKQTLIIIDDCLYQSVNSQPIKDIIYNGRHYNVTLVIIEQSSMLPPQMRCQMDNVIIAPDDNISSLKKLYEHYFGIYPNFNTFVDVVHSLKSGPRLFLFKHTIGTDAVTWWCRADMTDKYLKYHIVNDSPISIQAELDASLPSDEGETHFVDNGQLARKLTNIVDALATQRNQTQNLIDQVVAIRNQLKM